MTDHQDRTELTRDEAAHILGLSVQQLDRLIRDGKIDAKRYSNRAVRVFKDSVLKAAAERRPLRVAS